LLLGARFVQADGTLTWGGAKVVKSVTGYDVPKLLVGSLGTLAILVEATLRLHPMPPATRSWRVGLPSYAAARAFLAALVDSPLRLRLACEPRRLLDWIAEGHAAAGRLGIETALLAQPGHGVIQMAVW